GQPLFEMVERLSARIDETFESLRASVASESGLVGFEVTGSNDLAPAFDSPAYRRLSKEIEALSADEPSLLVALGWLGRSHSNIREWHSLLSNARDIVAHGRQQYNAYFIAQMSQVNRGLAR